MKKFLCLGTIAFALFSFQANAQNSYEKMANMYNQAAKFKTDFTKIVNKPWTGSCLYYAAPEVPYPGVFVAVPKDSVAKNAAVNLDNYEGAFGMNLQSDRAVFDQVMNITIDQLLDTTPGRSHALPEMSFSEITQLSENEFELSDAKFASPSGYNFLFLASKRLAADGRPMLYCLLKSSGSI